MKNYNILINFFVFFVIFIFYALPPIFFISEPVTQINFPLNSLILFIFSAFLYYFTNQFFLQISKKNIPVLKLIFSSVLCFIFIFLLGMIFNFLATIFKIKDEYSLIPQNLKEYFFVILTFSFSAFFEEVMYRFFIPEELSFFLQIKFSAKIAFLISESLTLLIFALSHRYRGLFAILNAAIAHVILRFFYKRTKNIAVTSSAHFFYNTILFFLSLI